MSAAPPRRLNVANALTLMRLALLPVVVALVWPGHASRSAACLACVAYAVAGIIDVVDGAVARWLGQVTALGQYLDPLADKLFYLVTLVALLQLPRPWVPGWVVMLALARELMVTGLRGIASAEGLVLAAGPGGKLKTSFATAGICSLLVHYPYAIGFGEHAWVVDAARVGRVLTYISLVLAMTSAVGYTQSFLRARRPLTAAP